MLTINDEGEIETKATELKDIPSNITIYVSHPFVGLLCKDEHSSVLLPLIAKKCDIELIRHHKDSKILYLAMLPTFNYFREFILECSKCLSIKVVWTRKRDSRGEYIVIDGAILRG